MSAVDQRPSITFHVPTRESSTVKAARLLVQGRVRVQLVHRRRVYATVNGDTAVRHVTFTRERWRCDCPAGSASCSHVRAVQAIVDVSREPETQRSGPA